MMKSAMTTLRCVISASIKPPPADPAVEHPIDQLANGTFQTTTSKLSDRMARRIPPNGDSADRLRECCVRGVHCAALACHSQIQSEFVYANIQGQTSTHCIRERSTADIFQVDENMARAQRRDAVNTERFFFRKDVFPPGIPSPISTPLSTPHGSGANSPIEPNDSNSFPRKPRKLENCFGEAPRPEHGHRFGRIEDEYDAFSLDEIMNGKVRNLCDLVLDGRMLTVSRRRVRL